MGVRAEDFGDMVDVGDVDYPRVPDEEVRGGLE